MWADQWELLLDSMMETQQLAPAGVQRQICIRIIVQDKRNKIHKAYTKLTDVGLFDGDPVGLKVGQLVGLNDGCALVDGCMDAQKLGSKLDDGLSLGGNESTNDGTFEGIALREGRLEGDLDGFFDAVGFVLGGSEAMEVGVADGSFDFDGALVYESR